MKYNIINFNVISSTNKYLKENYSHYPEYTVVKADKQTEGKGRMSRRWESEEGKNLTFSILLKQQIDSEKMPLLSLVVGASLYETIGKYIKCEIKWPNDIIVNNKKIAGILVESIFSSKLEAVVLGIGINVNQEIFSNDLLIKATSLSNELKQKIDCEKLLNEFINEFDIMYNDFIIGNNRFINICKENNYLKQKEVFYNNKQIKVLDISDNGNLIIKDEEGIKELYFGEVTFTNTYNN